MKAKPQHYYLIATKVLSVNTDNNIPLEMDVNVLLRTDSKNFTAADMGKSQQIAQMTFFERIGVPTMKVVDVFFVSVSRLGLMTEEEFQRPPEGMVVQERKEPQAPGPFDA